VWFAVLCFGGGLALGVAGGRAWEDAIDYWRRRTYLAEARRDPMSRLRAIQRADSLAALRDPRMRRAVRPPLEVRRAQAGGHCAITYTFTPESEHGYPLLSARADDPRSLVPVGQAWAYKQGGFHVGDSVTIVIPNAACSSSIVSGWSWGNADPPRPRGTELLVP
jgi:hypothetical protein